MWLLIHVGVKDNLCLKKGAPEYYISSIYMYTDVITYPCFALSVGLANLCQ